MSEELNRENLNEENVETNGAKASENTVEIENNTPKKGKKKKKSFWGEVLDWVISIGVAVVAVAIINMFIFVQVQVDGKSMYPTLEHGDRLFAVRFMYTPEQGDIVVLEPYLETGSVKAKLMFGRTLYIKRVIATGGQEIDIREDGVYIDGELYDEPYISETVRTYGGNMAYPLTVPNDCVFVMGDNREHSKDSRDPSVGIVRNDQIVGKASFRIFPFKDFGIVK